MLIHSQHRGLHGGSASPRDSKPVQGGDLGVLSQVLNLTRGRGLGERQLMGCGNVKGKVWEKPIFSLPKKCPWSLSDLCLVGQSGHSHSCYQEGSINQNLLLLRGDSGLIPTSPSCAQVGKHLVP